VPLPTRRICGGDGAGPGWRAASPSKQRISAGLRSAAVDQTHADTMITRIWRVCSEPFRSANRSQQSSWGGLPIPLFRGTCIGFRFSAGGCVGSGGARYHGVASAVMSAWTGSASWSTDGFQSLAFFILIQCSALTPLIRGGSRMRRSARGAVSNGRPYCDSQTISPACPVVDAIVLPASAVVLQDIPNSTIHFQPILFSPFAVLSPLTIVPFASFKRAERWARI